MSGSEHGSGAPEGAKDFKFDKGADIVAAEPAAAKPEAVVEPEEDAPVELYDVKRFGNPDEHNAAFMDAVEAKYLVEKGGQWWVTVRGAREFSNPTETKSPTVNTGFAAFRKAVPAKRVERPMFSSSHHKPVKPVEEVKPDKSIAQLDEALAKGGRRNEKKSSAEQDPNADIISSFKTIFSKFNYKLVEYTLTSNGYTDDGEEAFKFYAEWFYDNNAPKKKIITRTFKGTIAEIFEDIENVLNK